MLFGPHVAVLRSFAESHLTGGPDDALILLKLEHSLRVFDNAGHILDAEGVKGRMADLARLAALYHDMGRFPQYARYRTFNDRDSANHARLGVLALRGMEMPPGLSGHDWRIVRFAVAQHNAKSLNPALPARLELPVTVVRDADKLDIIRILLDHFEGNGEPSQAVIHRLDDAPDLYSEEIYDAIINGRTGDYRHMRYANDFKLLLMGWLDGLRYRSSLDMALERNYPARLLAQLPNDARIRRLGDAALSRISSCA
ncbi:HD domain-containing protein [Pseudodesulfovibrio sp. F-1]|uniref:HD domain-containing protein n=1 Tax=Pseudodesulfovibrio alkaliphilus TaxID=2661613 RepID=A0A7K1KLT7_9BACT|nr:HD domain-containing protein [Pseudodesulfovibrio alkaliphilus]MUM77043.1 HD domain-containing protein [Pseudodesulfovibrio alkaliphilus]